MGRLHHFTLTACWQIATAQVFPSGPELLLNNAKGLDPVAPLKQPHQEQE